mmetsp:Transcript_20697/g.30032  ORF Transcript_20697/g.30032 Transcript_20697/m.30032 type:complete len:381 (+) Transcript_20697:231-1373(+)
MPLKIPPELKKINAFVRRAEELDRDKSPESRLVAYYCRQFAVQTGISLAASPDGKLCLGELLNQLESEKGAMSVFTPDEAHVLCRKFADRIFDKADAEDRAGTATKATAKTFYAAASFYEILQQFYPKGMEEEEENGDDQKDEERKRIYCKWKATEILKAIKEGRIPEPGGYQEKTEMDEGGSQADETPAEISVAGPPPKLPVDDSPGIFVPKPPPPPMDDSPDVFVPKPPPYDENQDGSTDGVGANDDGNDEGTEVDVYGPAPTYPGPPESQSHETLPKWGESKGKPKAAINRPPVNSYQPPPAPAPVPAPAPSAPSRPISNMNGGGGGWGTGAKKGRISKEEFGDAAELTKFALAAIEHKDADLAAERLRQALEILGR